MNDFPYYPVQDYGPVMKGLVIGGLGIFHVFLAQFAIGGGMLMCYFQWLSQSGRDPLGVTRKFIDDYFKYLVLISFAMGALTGVGMWFTSIQISPRTIGLMVDEFHWLWATEWTFFCLEVVAGYAFFRHGRWLPDRMRFRLLLAYTAAAWFSLFWINGILSWQLTPGRWLESGSVWDGFFNPSFFPSLLFRTVVCMVIASLASCVVVNTMAISEQERRFLIHRSALFLLPMLAMPAIGFWFLSTLAEDSRQWVMGGSIAMTMFLNIAVGASVLIAGYAIVGLVWQRLAINGATAMLLLALAFGATAGGEFVREGVRKPYTVRQTLYSNAMTPASVAYFREHGSAADDPYPLLDEARYPTDHLKLGARVFRIQCAICHTEKGVNGLVHLTGTWTQDQRRMNIAQLQRTKNFMPPFAGPPEEVEALVQWLGWLEAGEPTRWEPATRVDALADIAEWLAQAGVGTSHRPAD
jgi:cytochrome d ubiquinol oxidase subunit I